MPLTLQSEHGRNQRFVIPSLIRDERGLPDQDGQEGIQFFGVCRLLLVDEVGGRMLIGPLDK